MMCVECLLVMLSAIMLCVSLCSVSDSVIVDAECHYAVCIVMFSVTFCYCYAECHYAVCIVMFSVTFCYFYAECH